MTCIEFPDVIKVFPNFSIREIEKHFPGFDSRRLMENHLPLVWFGVNISLFHRTPIGIRVIRCVICYIDYRSAAVSIHHEDIPAAVGGSLKGNFAPVWGKHRVSNDFDRVAS